MSFQHFLRLVRKRWSIVIICVVGMGLGAYMGSTLLLQPVYASTVKVQVTVRTGGNPFSKDNIKANQNLAATEADLATGSQVLSEVASHYPGLSANDLSNQVTADTGANTPLVAITVRDHNPTQAATIANDVATTLIKQQRQTMQPPSTEGAFLVVVDPAHPASAPVSPNKTLSGAAGLSLGLVIGALLAVLFGTLDSRVSTKDELTQLLGWPLLATTRKTPKKEAFRANSYNGNVEDYNLLHANIDFNALKKGSLRTFVITSSLPGEGKTVIAANLAMHLALAGKKTLLIDANLHHPGLGDLFALPPQTQGFTNALITYRISPASTRQQQGLLPFIRPVNVPNLSILLSGPLPPRPSEMLTSDAIEGMLKELDRSGFEIAIFDAPSLPGLADAAMLASKVDGTIVVVDMKNARKGTLLQTKELLEQAGAHVLGYVANNYPQSHKSVVPYK